MNLEHMESALRDGGKLHTFRSGGGLRVVRVEDAGKKLLGYGEAPCVEEAFKHANDDCLAGGRPYEEVYGGLYPHYLTGSCSVGGPLDKWTIQGYNIDARFKDGMFICELKGYKHTDHKKITDKVLKDGKVRQVKDRGYTYEYSSDRFPSGKACVSGRIINESTNKDGADPWMYKITKTARSPRLFDAMITALDAKEVEYGKD